MNHADDWIFAPWVAYARDLVHQVKSKYVVAKKIIMVIAVIIHSLCSF